MRSLVYELTPGSLLKGRYKLLKALGQGGFGITYVAWDSELRRRVAVKECFPVGICVREPDGGVVRPMRSEWEPVYLRALDDMHKEASTLANLSHENVVRIHDIIWGNGSVFCVMPWLPSGSLKDRMKDSLPTSEQSIRWLRQLLDALDYLHKRGIIHRDLKPDNIMFDEDDKPVIIDFGAALNRPERTTTTTTQGAFSRGYAAPEQITGKGVVGPWTDFYALSATWYELLTGIQPEAGDARLMQDDLAPLTSQQCRLSYPSELLALLQLNLCLHPVERCQSVEQWLQCWNDGVLPLIPLPKGGKMRRRRWLQIAAAVSLLGGAGFAAWYALPVQRVEIISSAADPAQVKKSLESKVRQLFKLDEYEALCASARARLPEVGATYEARAQELLQRTEKAMAQLVSSDEAYKLADDLQREYDALVGDRKKAAEECINAFHASIRPFRRTAAEMSADYQPGNMDEAALFPQVCEEQERRCKNLYDAVDILFAEVCSMKEETDRRYMSLQQSIIAKASELELSES